jgi:hypothetical protein
MDDVGVGVGVGAGAGAALTGVASRSRCPRMGRRQGRNGRKSSRLVMGSSLWERWKGRRGGRSSMETGIRRLKRWKERGAENGGAMMGAGVGVGEGGGGVAAVSLGVE